MFPKILGLGGSGGAQSIIPALAKLPPPSGGGTSAAPTSSGMFPAKPIILSKNNPGLQGHTPFSGIARHSSTSHGDIIADRYHKYNSIETLAPLVSQDENLSLVLNAKSAKIFMNPRSYEKAKNIMVFAETSPEGVCNNISFLVNQTD
jgi:hypothetical protein